MGAAVSSDNDELTDYLVTEGSLKHEKVERAFRLVAEVNLERDFTLSLLLYFTSKCVI